MTRFVLGALIVAVAGMAGCSSRSITCQCVRGDGTTDFIDLDGGSCEELAQGSQGYSSCVPVIVINNLLGPEFQRRVEGGDALPSLDRPWSIGRDSLR